MFDNWWKDFDPLDYKAFKSNVNKFNQKITDFWKDFYNDVFNNIKKDDK